MGDYSRRRSPRRLGRTGTVQTPSPTKSYAVAVNEVSVVEFYPALRVNGRG